MKTQKKRALAFLMSVLMMLCLPVWAAAEGPLTAADQMEAYDIYESEPINVQSYEGTANGTGSLYSTLNARQKAAYNALKDISWSRIISSPNRRVSVNISGITGAPITGYVSGGSFHASGSGVQAYRDMGNDVNAAIGALRYDRPDLLWLDGTVSYVFSFRGYSYVGNCTITDFSFIFPMTYGGQENTLRERMMAEARNIAGTAMREKDTYNRVKLVHDMLAQRSSYNYAALTAPENSIMYRLAHSAYGGMFLDQYDPVCEGYAKAFKVVLNQMDIPCVLVVGGDNHMWNNVLMDDGLWYNVDLTWDDSGDQVGYRYFLMGSTDFPGDHREEDPFNGMTSGARYPRKSTVAYNYIGGDYPSLTYPDVPRSDYAYEYIEQVSQLGYFSGDNYGRFNPGRNITRAEFARVTASVLGVDVTQYNGRYSFSDVGTGKWYSGAVYWARESGIMVGSGERFRPEAPISRQEMCSVLARALGLESLQAGIFPDDASIAGWARDGVYACYTAGLVTGSNGGNFNPAGNTIRRDAAIVFAKYARSMGIVPSGGQ